MNKEIRYWCSDCNYFVKENHRCQQWETVSSIPVRSLQTYAEEVTEKNEKLIDDCYEMYRSFIDAEEKLDKAVELLEDYAADVEDAMDFVESLASSPKPGRGGEQR